MNKPIKKTYHINAPTPAVWDALTNPELIKQYFFGLEAKSDWRKGSTIDYTGEWGGEKYRDKGIIEELIPERRLTINYWSGRTAKLDLPENYRSHTYNLESAGNMTILTMEQEDKFNQEESRSTAWQHWDIVVDGLKKIVENQEQSQRLPRGIKVVTRSPDKTPRRRKVVTSRRSFGD